MSISPTRQTISNNFDTSADSHIIMLYMMVFVLY